MMETDDYDRVIHPVPVTFRDRVAFALCAHDIGTGEGRMEDHELEALERVISRIEALYGSDKALGQFLGTAPGFAQRMMTSLRGFAMLERGFRETEGKQIAHAHMIAADWRSYLRSADAAIGVMIERPEAVRQIVSATPSQVEP